MPLTVAPAAGYDSFVSRAEADAYFAERGYAAWAAASETDRDNALRVGSVYVNAKRPIPANLYPVVHDRIKWATIEAAKLAQTGALYRTGSSQAVIEKSVGPLTLRYAPPSVGQNFNSNPYIDDLLSGLTFAGSAGGPIFFERV